MVGSRFVELFDNPNDLYTPTNEDLDITNKEVVDSFFREHEFQILIHFAAFTNVDEAEKERGSHKGESWKVNVIGTKNLAEACKKHSVYMIYISTDMVFSGSIDNPGPYFETSIPTSLESLTWYGWTKKSGEEVVKQVLPTNSSIVRIIYPVRAQFAAKLDYIRKPLSLLKADKLYPLFYDQQISITFIDDLVLLLNYLVGKKTNGFFHCASELTNPYELIKALAEKCGYNPSIIKYISLDTFLTNKNLPSYRYPKFGGLDSSKTQKLTGLHFRNTSEILDELIKQGVFINAI